MPVSPLKNGLGGRGGRGALRKARALSKEFFWRRYCKDFRCGLRHSGRCHTDDEHRETSRCVRDGRGLISGTRYVFRVRTFGLEVSVLNSSSYIGSDGAIDAWVVRSLPLPPTWRSARLRCGRALEQRGVDEGVIRSGFEAAEKHEFFMPSLVGRIMFSTRLVSISSTPWRRQ